MCEIDYRAVHEHYSDEEILADVTLVFPGESPFRDTPARILLEGMESFTPPDLRCCLAVWRNGLCGLVYYGQTQSRPTREQIISAFHMALTLAHFRENEEGTWLWA